MDLKKISHVKQGGHWILTESQPCLGTEVGLDYAEDAEIKKALSRNKVLKPESLNTYNSQALF